MAEKKVSAYQKLKSKNLLLHQDIYKMLNGSFLEKLEIEMKYKMMFQLEDIVWGSNTNKK